MSRQISVAIVEDNEAMRGRLQQQIEANADYLVVSACATLEAARKALEETTPDVLLVDLGLPDGDGCDLIAEHASRSPDIAIMVISVFGDEDRVIRAIQAGARGYLLKDEDSEGIGMAIEQLLSGGSPISPSIARHLISRFAPKKPTESLEPERLSKRELEVLELAAKGFTYQESADMLGVSINTVSSHTKNIYAKLAVNSRAEAVFEASQRGLVDLRKPE